MSEESKSLLNRGKTEVIEPEIVEEPDKIERRGRPTLLTPESEASILAGIRAGAFGWVAAQSAGVASSTFAYWCNKGRQDIEPYASFYKKVQQARAQARMRVELRVAQEKPDAWLRLGPGRDYGNPEEPGWTDPKIHISGKVEHKHAHAHVHVGVGDSKQVIDLTKLSMEELHALEQITNKALPAAGEDSRSTFEQPRESGDGEEEPA